MLFAGFDSFLDPAKIARAVQKELPPPLHLLPAVLVEYLYIFRVFFQICKEPFPTWLRSLERRAISLGLLRPISPSVRWLFPDLTYR